MVQSEGGGGNGVEWRRGEEGGGVLVCYDVWGASFACFGQYVTKMPRSLQ